MNAVHRVRGWLSAGVLAVGLLATVPGEATVVVPLSRAELVQRSTLVVHATVVSRSTAWNADHSRMLTTTHLNVLAYLSGTGGTTLLLEQFGGAIDGLASRVEGDAALEPGQEGVFFLRVVDGRAYLTALAQSVYYVTRTPGRAALVRRDLGGLSFAQPSNGTYVIDGAPLELAETFEHLLADIAALARGTR